MRTFVVLLRVLALLLGLGSVAGCGLLVYRWHSTLQEARDAERELRQARGGDVEKARLALTLATTLDQEERRRQIREGEEYDRRHWAFPFLAAGLALGLLGTVLALAGKTGSAAALMLAAVVGPALFHPGTLLFTAGFAAGCLLCLLAGLLGRKRSRPAAAEEA